MPASDSRRIPAAADAAAASSPPFLFSLISRCRRRPRGSLPAGGCPRQEEAQQQPRRAHPGGCWAARPPACVLLPPRRHQHFSALAAAPAAALGSFSQPASPLRLLCLLLTGWPCVRQRERHHLPPVPPEDGRSEGQVHKVHPLLLPQVSQQRPVKCTPAAAGCQLGARPAVCWYQHCCTAHIPIPNAVHSSPPAPLVSLPSTPCLALSVPAGASRIGTSRRLPPPMPSQTGPAPAAAATATAPTAARQA